MKRTLDVVVSAIALALLAPLLALAALAVRLDSPGPVLFRQRRIGLGGAPFELLKLRTMVSDASALGGHSTTANDPRITRVGALLRRASLDEIPQLVNVVRGDMSIVGPRPCVPAQHDDYEPADWERRHHVRPGITGLAQVNGRSATSFDDRLRYDLEYVDSHRMRDDLAICLRTARQLFRGQAN